jgi:hypothetical protein
VPDISMTTGWRISPMLAASLCMKPTLTLTPSDHHEGGRFEGNFAELRRDAAVGDAVPRPSARSQSKQADRFLHDA